LGFRHRLRDYHGRSRARKPAVVHAHEATRPVANTIAGKARTCRPGASPSGSCARPSATWWSGGPGGSHSRYHELVPLSPRRARAARDERAVRTRAPDPRQGVKGVPGAVRLW